MNPTMQSDHNLKCRFCNNPLNNVFVDLGMSPLANSYLKAEQLNSGESFYPLCVYVCDKCYLVQLPEHESPDDIFSDYAYFSSFSDSWLEHAKNYCDKTAERFSLNGKSRVIEIASNDGYLLQYFKEKAIPVLGIEPASNVAKAAEEKGITSIVKFFGTKTANDLAMQDKHADLLIGNNVLAHVPDINDFVMGMKIILKSEGVITMEFPHLMRLVDENQFDTIYHEHFSYFSFIAVNKIFSEHGLTIFDVEELPTHGGSLRIYACHSENGSNAITDNVKGLIIREEDAGLTNLSYYHSFNKKVKGTKRNALDFLIKVKREDKSIVCYGAAAKGNTLLNYCGIRNDFIDYAADRSTHKQGLFLPGTHIPVYSPEKVRETKPDFLVISAWNIKDEVMEQMDYIREWGGKFVVLIPEVRVYE